MYLAYRMGSAQLYVNTVQNVTQPSVRSPYRTPCGPETATPHPVGIPTCLLKYSFNNFL